MARPRPTRLDRVLLVALASRVRSWRSALLIVQPDTLLRWRRRGFRLLWQARSRAMSRTPRMPPETVALIVAMARDNRLWGAERIRGELLKLGVRVSKGTPCAHRGLTPCASDSWAASAASASTTCSSCTSAT